MLFEAKVARILRLAFQRQGLTEPEIDEKFEMRDGIPRSITGLLKTHLPDLTGISVDDNQHPLGQAYAQWCVKARDLRNDIAHGKSLRVSQIQAQEAIIAVREFLTQIEALLPDRHRTKIGVPVQDDFGMGLKIQFAAYR